MLTPVFTVVTGEWGSSRGPDGPSHAADRPTLLDRRQPGPAHTTPLQTYY